MLPRWVRLAVDIVHTYPQRGSAFRHFPCILFRVLYDIGMVSCMYVRVNQSINQSISMDDVSVYLMAAPSHPSICQERQLRWMHHREERR